MTLAADASVAAVRNSSATTAVATGTIAANTLLALFCHADSDDGNATESLSISAGGGFTWTKNIQKNGSPGAVVAVFTAPVPAGSATQTVSIADSRGNKAKSVKLVKFTDDNGGIPGAGATLGGTNTLNLTSTATGSWAWLVGLGGAAVTTAVTGQTLRDSVTGSGFDGGDNICTQSVDALSTASAQTIVATISGGASQGASIEITPGTGGGGGSDHAGAVTPTVTASLTTAAVHDRPASSTPTVTASLVPAGAATRSAAVTAQTTAALTPAPTHVRTAAVSASATASLTAAGSHTRTAAVTATAVPAVALSAAGQNSAAITATVKAALTAAFTAVRGAAISALVTARLMARTGASRDLEYTAGQPQVGWRTGPPTLGWDVDPPQVGWRTKPPSA